MTIIKSYKLDILRLNQDQEGLQDEIESHESSIAHHLSGVSRCQEKIAENKQRIDDLEYLIEIHTLRCVN